MNLDRLLKWLPLLTLFAGAHLSVSEGSVISQPRFGYSVTLPADWEQIPQPALDNYIRTINAIANSQFGQGYQDGFQRFANGAWFKYPYVLVQVTQSGRIPESQLAQMKSLRSKLQEGLNSAAKTLDTIMSGMTLGDTYYDASNRCILIRLSLNVAGVGEVKALTCGFLTQKGILSFHCYARAADFDGLLPIFQDLLNSVQLSPELRYQSRIYDRGGFDFGRVGRSALIGGIIGGLVGLISMLVKKRQSNKSGPPPLS